MTGAAESRDTALAEPAWPELAPPHRKLYWWKEALIIAAFYGVYSVVRNLFGSYRVDAGEEPMHAFINAMRIIRLEEWFGAFKEQPLQDAFLPYSGFIQFWNVFYGTAHFAVTLITFVWLFRRARDTFPIWRNALAITTAVALLGFALFPLMPPRLLNNDDSIYGGGRIAAAQQRPDYRFVDTVGEFGGPWRFDSGTGQKVSNQYAAMPSLHIGWSTWCVSAMWGLTRRRWLRVLLVLYPLLTLFCILVTANHYWLDGVGGLVALAVGFALGRWMSDWNDRRQLRRLPHTGPVASAPPC